MAKIKIPVELTEKYAKDMEAIKDCIEFGHDLKFESCSVFGNVTEKSLGIYRCAQITHIC